MYNICKFETLDSSQPESNVGKLWTAFFLKTPAKYFDSNSILHTGA